MEIVKLLVGNLFLILVFAAVAFAQTEKSQVSNAGKIAIINTETFYDKEKGIKELIEVVKKINAELKPYEDELQELTERVKKAENRLKFLTGSNDLTIEEENKRIKEYELAVRDLKTKQEETKIFSYRCRTENVVDFNKKLKEGINQFARENDYLMILDISRVGNFVIIGKPKDIDITTEFIKYYNENFDKEKRINK